MENETNKNRMPGTASYQAKRTMAMQRKPKPSGKGFKRRAAVRAAQYWQHYASNVVAAYDAQSQQMAKLRRWNRILVVSKVCLLIFIGVTL